MPGIMPKVVATAVAVMVHGMNPVHSMNSAYFMHPVVTAMVHNNRKGMKAMMKTRMNAQAASIKEEQEGGEDDELGKQG
jgi:hypothetical protein